MDKYEKFFIYDTSTNKPINDMNSMNTKVLSQISTSINNQPNNLEANANNVAHLLMQECNVNPGLLSYLIKIGVESNLDIPF
jgi:hypothetical protein